MSFNIGLSGMRAASSDLNVTGNNIANAGTAGFKQSRAEFSDVYAASVMGSGSNQQGSGVVLSNVSQQFKQGNISYTGNALDLAVNGNGFFVTSNGGERGYTRAGYFGTDNQGFIVNNAGHRLQGSPVDAAGNLQNGVISDLRVLTANQAPQPTSSITQRFNLNSEAVIKNNSDFDPAKPETYSSSTSLNIYDAQGNAHVMTQYFVKTGPNDWAMNVLVDGRNPGGPLEPAMSQVLEFGPSGQLNNVPIAGIVDLGAWDSGNGASTAAIKLDITGSTQYATSFAVSSVSQNGFSTGQLAGLEIDDSGVLFARYTNGQSMAQGQVVLADFANVQGLTPQGNTGWSQSFASGEPVIGTPRSGTLGALQAGALEDSNVELSDQLVNLIVAQRNYQANAKTIETESAITQTIINLR